MTRHRARTAALALGALLTGAGLTACTGSGGPEAAPPAVPGSPAPQA